MRGTSRSCSLLPEEAEDLGSEIKENVLELIKGSQCIGGKTLFEERKNEHFRQSSSAGNKYFAWFECSACIAGQLKIE